MSTPPEMPPTRTLSETESKALLADHGVPVLDERVVDDPPAAAAAAAELGFPVVAKLCGDRIAHKTERGLVRLGLADAAASPDADGSGDARGGFAEGEEPWKQDDVQLRARLTGLKSALEAERVEVDGNTVHVYFPDGTPLMAETSWCDIADVNLPDDYSVVTHWEGKETAC